MSTLRADTKTLGVDTVGYESAEIVGLCGSPLGKGVPGVSVFIMVGVSRAVANKLQSKVIKAYPRLQVQLGR